MSITISLPGVLKRAADVLDKSDGTGLGFALRELLGHLRQVRANPEQIGEFFELWTDHGG